LHGKIGFSLQIKGFFERNSQGSNRHCENDRVRFQPNLVGTQREIWHPLDTRLARVWVFKSAHRVLARALRGKTRCVPVDQIFEARPANRPKKHSLAFCLAHLKNRQAPANSEHQRLNNLRHFPYEKAWTSSHICKIPSKEVWKQKGDIWENKAANIHVSHYP
jgi:hypothetical protein